MTLPPFPFRCRRAAPDGPGSDDAQRFLLAGAQALDADGVADVTGLESEARLFDGEDTVLLMDSYAHFLDDIAVRLLLR